MDLGTVQSELSLPTDPVWLTEPVSFSSTMVGRAKRWNGPATLPLRAGASARNDTDRWSIISVTTPSMDIDYLCRAGTRPIASEDDCKPALQFRGAIYMRSLDERSRHGPILPTGKRAMISRCRVL